MVKLVVWVVVVFAIDIEFSTGKSPVPVVFSRVHKGQEHIALLRSPSINSSIVTRTRVDLPSPSPSPPQQLDNLELQEDLPPTPQCGQIAQEKNLRVVGGADVGRYKYPWFANLILKNSGGSNCAGTLITSRHVLTAAHCFSGTSGLADMYTVVLGSYNMCDPEEKSETFDVDSVKVHENYATLQPFFDIAMMTLARTADTFTTICLPPKGIFLKPRNAQIVGFGATRFGANTEPCTMMEAGVRVYRRHECLNPLRSSLTIADLGPGVFCAGNFRGGVDSCQGDSGGPLQYVNGNAYYVIGIVSFGYGCGDPRLPGIYTDVTEYMDWISDAAEIK